LKPIKGKTAVIVQNDKIYGFFIFYYFKEFGTHEKNCRLETLLINATMEIISTRNENYK
jgi:hypothetical protein